MDWNVNHHYYRTTTLLFYCFFFLNFTRHFTHHIIISHLVIIEANIVIIHFCLYTYSFNYAALSRETITSVGRDLWITVFKFELELKSHSFNRRNFKFAHCIINLSPVCSEVFFFTPFITDQWKPTQTRWAWIKNILATVKLYFI